MRRAVELAQPQISFELSVTRRIGNVEVMRTDRAYPANFTLNDCSTADELGCP